MVGRANTLHALLPCSGTQSSTGSAASRGANAQSPFNRMGQHLGFADNSNMVRRYLRQNGVVPGQCAFRLVGVGPIEKETRGRGRREHDRRRDVVAAMGRRSPNSFASSGLNVMNPVKSRKPLDEARFAQVRAAFAGALPQLAAPGPVIEESPRAPGPRVAGSGAGRRGNRRVAGN